MTKPSYEELLQENGKLRQLNVEDVRKVSELEAELARVRGLLQRQWISVEERLPESRTHVLVTRPGCSWVPE